VVDNWAESATTDASQTIATTVITMFHSTGRNPMNTAMLPLMIIA
jgi:hypothetical protein|tara:strand:+ start:379 stop:513 length:135 start_codon:yes stop_codon:yes gene_type:complete